MQQAAASRRSPTLVGMVQPLAAPLFAEHRAAGRPIVMATTTPYDLVKPLADALGLDDVVATRYGVSADGTYDGTIDGPFVWSAGKLAAVREWAAEHDIDLAESYAYSDSVYDTPLLAAVGHPFVVNPDPRLRLMAAARRWPMLDLSVRADAAAAAERPRLEHGQDPGGQPRDLQRLALELHPPDVLPVREVRHRRHRAHPAAGRGDPRRQPPQLLRLRGDGGHDRPDRIAPCASSARRRCSTPRSSGRSPPRWAASASTGHRLGRAAAGARPRRSRNGDLVAMMPQGTIPRGRAFFEPVLKGRWGAARLAAMTDAPVIPVGLWGTEQVWPRSARLPSVLNLPTRRRSGCGSASRSRLEHAKRRRRHRSGS